MSTEIAKNNIIHVVKTPKRKRAFRSSLIKLAFFLSLMIIIGLLIQNANLESEIDEYRVVSSSKLHDNWIHERLCNLQAELGSCKSKVEEFARTISPNRSSAQESVNGSTTTPIPQTVKTESASSLTKDQDKTEKNTNKSTTSNNSKTTQSACKSRFVKFFKDSAEAISAGAKKVFHSLKGQVQKINVSSIKWEKLNPTKYLKQGMGAISNSVQSGYKLVKDKFKNEKGNNASSPKREDKTKSDKKEGASNSFFAKTFSTISNHAKAAYSSIKNTFKHSTAEARAESKKTSENNNIHTEEKRPMKK